MASKIFTIFAIIILCHQGHSARFEINFSDKQLFAGDSCEIESYEPISGICKSLKDCKSVQDKIKSRIFDHKVCGYDKKEQIVCCPHDTTLPNKLPAANEGENCTYDTVTGEMGILKQDLNCQSNETYKLFNGLVCCPHTKQTPHIFDECSNIEEQLSSIEFVGPKCFDPKTGRTGICRPLDQAPPFNRAISELAICGSYCCQEFYCFPNTNTSAVSIARQKCSSYNQRTYSGQKLIPKEIFRSSNTCRSSSRDSKNHTSGNTAECITLCSKDNPHLAILGYPVSENNIFWNCAGALISETFVLSSAACLKQKNFGTVTKIRLGGNSAETLQYYDVKNIFEHPKFDPDLKYNDIGLIQMFQMVEFNNFINPVCLPATPEIPLKIQSIGLNGGHIINNNIEQLSILQAQQDIIAPEECNMLYENSIDVRFGNGYGLDESSQVCLAFDCEMRSTCQFNLGRLIINDASQFGNQNEIYGVASRGILCNGQSEIYTKIYPFVGWIDNIVWGSYGVANEMPSLSRFGDDEEEEEAEGEEKDE